VGLFAPDSVTWRINREAVLMLGGGRALLMQLAHPSVAAGVAEHSDFRQRPVHRLKRTLDLTLALTFGTRREALDAVRQINLVHQGVHGAGYSAADPRLLLWVQATLIDSAVASYRAFVGPLPAADEEAYFQEGKLIGGLLGLARARYPASLGHFRRYVEEMLEGDELRVDARARELAGAVLRPPLPLVPVAAYRPLEVVTAGLLPARLRADYGLRWGAAERTAFQAMRGCVRPLVGLLPSRLRYQRLSFRVTEASSVR
jgi:uncharacterized protein (DUF2236 family)